MAWVDFVIVYGAPGIGLTRSARGWNDGPPAAAAGCAKGVWATMDVFLCTGERSSDIMAADVATELRKRAGGTLHIEGLTGPIAEAAGVHNVFDHTDLAMVGIDSGRIRSWTAKLAGLVRLLRRRPPKVFVGVTHSIFNIPLAGALGEKVHKIMVGPPEIWAWQASGLSRLMERAAALLAWLHGDELSWLKAATVTVHRGEMSLRNFDELVCLFPMNRTAYTRLADKLGLDTKVRGVGHALANLHRPADWPDRAAALRSRLGIGGDAHILGVFPGSRPGAIDLLMPTMLAATAEILRRRADVVAAVSLADARFADQVREHIDRAALPAELAARVRPADATPSDLLCAATHAMLSSGTVTLHAACLAAKGTVAYTLRNAWLVKRLADRGRFHGRVVPFALPNAIMARSAKTAAHQPYTELIGRQFRPSAIAESILSDLPAGAYRMEDHPLLADAQVAAIRAALQPADEEDADVHARPGPVVAVAETILAHCG